MINNNLTREASTDYIFHPLVPKRVYSILPDIKLILLLRNPVDRAYSHYNHVVHRGAEDLSFEEALKKEPERTNEVIRQAKTGNIINLRNWFFYTYLLRGKYCEQIKNWLNYFPKDQLMAINSEDFFSNPAQVYSGVLEFLNIPSWQPDEFKMWIYYTYGKIKAKTRQKLINHYKPYNKELYRLLNTKFD